MNKIYIITGDLAAGKSTLALLLAKKLNIDVFLKDTIKEHLADTIGFTTREENYALSVKTFKIMLHEFSEHIYNHKDLILEANFREEELNKINVMAKFYNYEIKAFRVKGDINVLYDRFLKRLSTRHRAHKSLRLDESIETFEKYLNMIREQKIPFTYHEIDSTYLSPDDLVKEVLKY